MPEKAQAKKVTDPADLEKVFAIRREVFVGEQNCPPELEWEHEEESNHFLATVDGEPAGASRPAGAGGTNRVRTAAGNSYFAWLDRDPR